MQGGDDNKQKFVWMGLIVLAFIAGAVVSMAGLKSIHVDNNKPAAQPAPAAQAPAQKPH